MRTLFTSLVAVFLALNLSAGDNPYRATKPVPGDAGSFTMVVYPDPQGYMKYGENQPLFELMTAWTAANVERLNIKAVLCTGDLVEFNEMPVADPAMSDQNSTQQWQAVSRAYERLDGVVPYINCLGNHDYGYRSAEKRITNFSKYFPVSRNRAWQSCLVEVGLNCEGLPTLENAAYEFSDPSWGKILVLVTEFNPRDEILDWAAAICNDRKYRGHRVIVLTHSYMDFEGVRYETEGYKISPANYGKDIWERLLYPCPNIRLLICGHDCREGSYRDNVGFRTDKNSAGLDVHQMMFNAQTHGGGWEGNGGDGWLRILEFMPDGVTVRVKTFSPLLAVSPLTAVHAWRTGLYDEFDLSIER